MAENYLNFKNIIKETRDWNKDICKIREVKDRDKHIKDLCREIERLLNFLVDDKVGPNYLFGLIFEGLFKTILIKEKFDEFLLCYCDDKKPKSKFENSKKEVFNLLQDKELTKEQILRIKDVTELIQVQRNNFLHFPLKSLRHSAVYPEIYFVIIKLIELFELNFSKDIIASLNEKIADYKQYETDAESKFKKVW